MSARTSVSLVGLGDMGTALASAFISNSHPTTVWNRTASRADTLVARGATLASSAAACVSASELVIVCLLLNDTVREVFSGDTLKAVSGKTIVNLTNGTPSQAKDMEDLFTSNGAEYLDGGIMATPGLIGTPASFIFYSGSEAGIKRFESPLAVLGKVDYLGKSIGLAATLDTALLAGMYGAFAGAFQAMAMVRSVGLPVSKFTEEKLAPFIGNMTGLLLPIAIHVDKGEHPADGGNLAMQVAAIPNVLNTAREVGVWDGMLHPITKLMQRRVDHGGANEGLSALVDEMSLEKNE
ncbi:hypothetical protein FQN57_004173 [Myotisia sp. PD_48]|nr:hypothetical protein FQN57_004173 [Myotisia sp. PD_48]